MGTLVRVSLERTAEWLQTPLGVLGRTTPTILNMLELVLERACSTSWLLVVQTKPNQIYIFSTLSPIE